MTKFWMMVAATLALGSMTGCADDSGEPCTGEGCVCGDRVCSWSENCESCPTDCAFMCADADAGDDADTAGDDADTAEVANCPNIQGDWALTLHNDIADRHSVLRLWQTGCSLTGDDDYCNYADDGSSSIAEDGTITLMGACAVTPPNPPIRITLTGNLLSPPQLRGTFLLERTPPWADEWWADPQ